MVAISNQANFNYYFQFVYHSGSIITAQMKHRCEFNKSPPHKNLIRKWFKKVSEVGDVKKKNCA